MQLFPATLEGLFFKLMSPLVKFYVLHFYFRLGNQQPQLQMTPIHLTWDGCNSKPQHTTLTLPQIASKLSIFITTRYDFNEKVINFVTFLFMLKQLKKFFNFFGRLEIRHFMDFLFLLPRKPWFLPWTLFVQIKCQI